MRSTPVFGALIAALIPWVLTLPLCAQDGTIEGFEALLEDVTELMEREKWKSARTTLLEGLDAHEGRPYAFARRTEIEEMVRLCAFWEENDAPKPKELVSGKLDKYSEQTGQLRITYGEDEHADFERVRYADTLWRIHPAPFVRKHTVEFRSPAYSGNVKIIVAADLPETAYVISLGYARRPPRYKPARIQRVVDLEYQEVAGNSVVLPRVGEPIRIKVTVTERDITVSLDGKKILTCDKDPDLWGRVGFIPSGNSPEIKLDGRVERAWIQGLQDEAVAKSRRKFERRFRAKKHFPKWWFQAADDGESKSSSELWVQLARVEAERSSIQGAITLLRDAVEQDPKAAEAWGELAWLCLVVGRVDEARAAVRDAHSQGLSGKQLDRASRALVKLDRGPGWSTSFEWKSDHYHVVSDIDKRTCKDAADVLEAAYRLYRDELGPLERRDERFRVYLFSGEASYERYCEDLGAELGATWGAYFPALQQLVIWNVPKREDMLRTVRHEGMHQYVHGMVSGLPKWLDEGLAEYFENAEHEGGRWTLGGVHSYHRLILKRNDPYDLDRFLSLSSGEFMQNAQRCYAQAWAFVHFLRHGPLAEEDLVGAYLGALGETGSRAKAHARVFGRRNLKVLDAQFRAHLVDLLGP